MKEKWAKAKEFFSRPKVKKWTVIILIILVVVGSLKALVWAIYTQDKPAFVPEDVRADVRGAIVEKIGKPLQQISNPAGTFIINAAWKSQGNMYGLEKQDDKTKNWPKYTDEETGISFKYPEGWLVDDSGDYIKMFESKYSNYESEYPQIIIKTFDYDGNNLNNWLDSNKEIFIGDQDPLEVPGFAVRVPVKVGALEGLEFEYESMGTNKVTLLRDNAGVIVVENVTLGSNDLENYYQNVLETFK